MRPAMIPIPIIRMVVAITANSLSVVMGLLMIPMAVVVALQGV
jgi:hypothetical protein